MKKFIIFILLFSTFSVYAEDSSFCDDPALWDNFNSMVKRNPNDIPLQILHALRIGLCVKIKQNTISKQEALYLFDDMLMNVANKRGEEEEIQKKGKL